MNKVLCFVKIMLVIKINGALNNFMFSILFISYKKYQFATKEKRKACIGLDDSFSTWKFFCPGVFFSWGFFLSRNFFLLGFFYPGKFFLPGDFFFSWEIFLTREIFFLPGDFFLLRYNFFLPTPD